MFWTSNKSKHGGLSLLEGSSWDPETSSRHELHTSLPREPCGLHLLDLLNRHAFFFLSNQFKPMFLRIMEIKLMIHTYQIAKDKDPPTRRQFPGTLT